MSTMAWFILYMMVDISGGGESGGGGATAKFVRRSERRRRIILDFWWKVLMEGRSDQPGLGQVVLGSVYNNSRN